jgi:hypothetical protein
MSELAGPHVHFRPRPAIQPVPTRVPFSFVHINKCGGSSVEIALGLSKRHATAEAMRREIGADAWASRFSFALVRNPFDRVVSLYYYRVRRDYHGLGDRHLNLNEWISALWQENTPRYTDPQFLSQPCCRWLTDAAGGELVDVVIRLEDIDRRWPEITDRLGVDCPLPALNANRRPAYRDVLAPASRAIIERAFAEDLSRFDYDY